MIAIKATFKNGAIVPDGPVPWREGSRLVVHEDALADVEFMTEDEQSDDPESVERWIAELRALPPLVMTPQQEAELMAWREKVKAFNIEAIRRQMTEGLS